jgi:hypothetical protein
VSFFKVRGKEWLLSQAFLWVSLRVLGRFLRIRATPAPESRKSTALATAALSSQQLMARP